jgi:DMSO/TMAO reductase YedYZ heme-binding membrane subunit
MSLIVALIMAVVLAFILRKPLSVLPIPCYVLAALISAAGIYLTINPQPILAVRAVASVIQKGQLGFGLFAIVMFVGAFGKDSVASRYFGTVRTELSIFASILIVGHFALYIGNYLRLIGGFFGLPLGVMSSLVIAFIMLVLLVLLFSTSLRIVKKNMSVLGWKRVQRLAYPFFILIWLHLFGFLAIPALNGSMAAIVNLCVYSAVFITYAALRIRQTLAHRERVVGTKRAVSLR